MFKNWALWINIYVICVGTFCMFGLFHINLYYYYFFCVCFLRIFSVIYFKHSIVACKKRAVLFIIGRIFICTGTNNSLQTLSKCNV